MPFPLSVNVNVKGVVSFVAYPGASIYSWLALTSGSYALSTKDLKSKTKNVNNGKELLMLSFSNKFILINENKEILEMLRKLSHQQK